MQDERKVVSNPVLIDKNSKGRYHNRLVPRKLNPTPVVELTKKEKAKELFKNK